MLVDRVLPKVISEIKNGMATDHPLNKVNTVHGIRGNGVDKRGFY